MPNKQYRLSTVDNPFDPLNDPVGWTLYDAQLGYYSANYLARRLLSSDQFTDEEEDEANEQAIDDIINDDITGLYLKVEYQNKNGRWVPINLPTPA